MLVMRTDVLIVGAGPTGLSLSCQLIRYGVDHMIIDAHETTTPHSKAIGVQARTLEIYEQIGLADELIALGRPAEGAKLFTGGKIRGQFDFRGMGAGMSPYPFVLIVEQGKHEALLHRYITSNSRSVDWRTSLLGFSQNDNGVTAEIAGPDGQKRTVECSYLIACDGAKSFVRHSLGLKFEGSTMDRMFYVADVDIDWQYGRGGLFAFLMKNNLLAVFSMDGDGKYRIVGTFPEEFSKDEGDVLYEEIEEQLRKDAEIEFDITKVNWFSTYRVHTRHVDAFSVGRIHLAGDAAHIHTPAGAQGMNTGIQDGYNLAWKLAAVLRKRTSTDLLATYNEERLPNAENLTSTTDRLFDMIASPSPLLAFARMYVFPLIARFVSRLSFVQRFIFPRISQIAINYRESSLSETHGSFNIKAGDRMPWFEVDGVSVYDSLHSPLFHLLIFDDGETEMPQLPMELMRQWDGLIDIHCFRLDDKMSKIFGTHSAFFIILRPDNYIGLISEDLSPGLIRSYLARF